MLQRLEELILQALTIEGCLETQEQMSEVHEQTPYAAFKGETAGEGGHEEGFAHAVGSGQKESLFRQTLTQRPLLNCLDGFSEGGRRLVMQLLMSDNQNSRSTTIRIPGFQAVSR